MLLLQLLHVNVPFATKTTLEAREHVQLCMPAFQIILTAQLQEEILEELTPNA
jgi:hypothetical protein